MDPLMEEQLDYGDEEYGSGQKLQYQGSGGAIAALAEEELMGDDDDYDDLYNDVNVGEGFMQTMQQRGERPGPFGNSGLPSQDSDGQGLPAGGQVNASHAGVGVEGKEAKSGYGHLEAEHKSAGLLPGKGLQEGGGNYHGEVPTRGTVPQNNAGNLGFGGNPSSTTVPPKNGSDPKFATGPPMLPRYSDSGNVGNPQPAMPNQPAMPAGNYSAANNDMKPGMVPVDSNGPTMLYVGELHWWTTDADLESVLTQYGRVKEIKFFDERASGKSKGYCQVEFYDTISAAACKEGMNGYVFNGRPCVVAYASPQTLKQMGASYMNKNQAQSHLQMQGRRQVNDGAGRGGGMNLQGGDGGRNFGRGGWGGRGGQGFQNRGQGGAGTMRGRGAFGPKAMGGAAGGFGAGTGAVPFGQGLTGPALGGPAGGLMHPQNMMGVAFDPTFMGRGAPYGGFAGPAFPGMMPPFQAVGTVGFPGVAPHVNPAFFGRGMPVNGIGMIGSSGMEGHPAAMWPDTSMGGWTAEEHGRRTRESSYGGDDVASDYGHGDTNHERGGRSNASQEKERGAERDWSGNSDRRNHVERKPDWERSDRERYREDKEGHREHRHRDRDYDGEDNWDRGHSSSRSRSKSRMEDDHRSRSRDADYGKRRRPSE